MLINDFPQIGGVNPADIPIFSIGGSSRSETVSDNTIKFLEEYGNPTESEHRPNSKQKTNLYGGKKPVLSTPNEEKVRNLINLTAYGYSLKNNSVSRHNSLRLAIIKNNLPIVYHDLYLLAHDSSDLKNKQIINKDIMYMKKLHKKIKKIHQKGGLLNNKSDTDDEFELVNLPEEKISTKKIIVQTINQNTNCDPNGKCHIKNTIYEKHQFDDREIIFYTLTIDDADQIHELDIKYLDSDQTIQQTREKIDKNPNLLIGIKSNGILQGYCHYKFFTETNEANETENFVKIVWFNANKSYGTPLYKFMEKYFLINGYNKVILTVSLKGSYAIRRLNFWNKMEFETKNINNTHNEIYMSKIIN